MYLSTTPTLHILNIPAELLMQMIILFGWANTNKQINSLMFLNLGGNRLTSIPTSAINKLTSLTNMDLQENQIHTITEKDFTGLKNLDSLKLAHNFIHELGPFVFNQLTKVSQLDLEGNRILKLDKSAFRGIEGKEICDFFVIYIFSSSYI